MKLVLIYTVDNCAHVQKLKESGFYNQLQTELDDQGYRYKTIGFNNFQDLKQKDDSRSNFHRNMLSFCPMFAVVPSELYENEHVTDQQLVEHTVVYNGEIVNGKVKPVPNFSKMDLDSILNFVKESSFHTSD